MKGKGAKLAMGARDALMAARYLDGLTYEEVGLEFDVHLTTARRGVLRGLNAMGERERENLDTRRQSVIRQYQEWIDSEPGDTVASRELRLKYQRRLDRITGVENSAPKQAPNVKLLRDILVEVQGGD